MTVLAQLAWIHLLCLIQNIGPVHFGILSFLRDLFVVLILVVLVLWLVLVPEELSVVAEHRGVVLRRLPLHPKIHQIAPTILPHIQRLLALVLLQGLCESVGFSSDSLQVPLELTLLHPRHCLPVKWRKLPVSLRANAEALLDGVERQRRPLLLQLVQHLVDVVDHLLVLVPLVCVILAESIGEVFALLGLMLGERGLGLFGGHLRGG